jgi:hypothetical protein
MTQEEYSTAYNKGREAFNKNLQLPIMGEEWRDYVDNPYPENSELFNAWDDGYIDRSFEIE